MPQASYRETSERFQPAALGYPGLAGGGVQTVTAFGVLADVHNGYPVPIIG